MTARSDSLFKRLTEEQRDSLILSIHSQVGGDVYKKGAELCATWGIKCSRSAVYDFFTRHAFAWRLDRAKAAAALTFSEESVEEETNRLVRQKLFEAVADINAEPKLLIMVRSLEIEAQKVKLADRRVTVLEAKIEKAHTKLQELLNPANDEAARKAILDEVDVIMGIAKK